MSNSNGIKTLITAAEFERQMKQINIERAYDRDEERSHILADKLMCDTLKSLGYEAGVVIFENMPKYYS